MRLKRFFTGHMRRVSIAFCAASLLSANSVQAQTVDWKTVGGWDVSFYTNSQGCQAFALFEKNTAFFIGFDNNDDQLTLDVTLLDERWVSIEHDKEYSVEVKFGNEGPWTLEMDGVVMDGYPGLNIMIDVETDEAALFIDEFQRETVMRWDYGKTTLGRYTLRGSRVAFDEVIACQKSYFEALASQTDPFATSDTGTSTVPFSD